MLNIIRGNLSPIVIETVGFLSFRNKNLKILPVIFFLLAIAMLYNRVFFKGEVIVPGDIPYNTPLWEGEAPEAKYYKAQNYLLSDQIDQFYVWHSFARESIKNGFGIPLWNPYIFAGQPLVANAQSALFYPPNLLLFIFSPGIVATIRIFFNLFILGLFSYFFSRAVGMGKKISAYVMFVSVLSGPVVSWLGHPHSNVFIWMPYLLYGIEMLFKKNNFFFWTAFISIGIGAALLGGHPETFFHLFIIISIYFLIRSFQELKKINVLKKRAYLMIAAVTLGFLIGAIQILPFSDYLFHSSTLSSGGRGAHGGNLFYSKEFIPDMASGITLLYPNFYGNPVDRDYLWYMNLKYLKIEKKY